MTLEDDEWRYMQEQEILGDYPRLSSDFYKVCDLLLDAYLTGYNAGTADGRQGSTEYLNSEGDLEELVTGIGLDPKIVLRRLYCLQQIEENGECKCQE